MSNSSVEDNILSRIRLEHRARMIKEDAILLRIANLERQVFELVDLLDTTRLQLDSVDRTTRDLCEQCDHC